MSHQNINSFRSVKASCLAFEKFQDRFLAKEPTLSPRSIKLTSPKRNLTIAEESCSKTETVSAIPFSIVPLGSAHEKHNRSIKLKSQDVDSDSKGSSHQTSGKITDTLNMFKLKHDPKINTLGNFSEAFSYLEKKNIRSSDKILEVLTKKEGGKMIPFIKGVYNKFRNATSLRDFGNLKLNHLKFIADSAYFIDPTQKNQEISEQKGIRKYMSNAINFGKWKFSLIMKTDFCKILMNFGENHQIIIHPYQNLKILWDIIHIIIIFFWFLYIPLLLSFEEADLISSNSSLYTIIFLSFDALVNLNTAYFKNGVVEKKRRRIVLNYIKNKLFLDSLTMISFCLDLYFIHEEKNFRIFVHLFKVLFFLKLNTIVEISHRLSEKLLVKENFQNIIALFKVLFISIFVAHLFACFWYLVSSQSRNYFENTWISNRGLLHSPWHQKYLYSIYWACVTMMTVGYGDIIPQNEAETIICLISVVLGCAVYAYNINSIGMILQDLNKENIEFDRKINIINQFMNKKNIKQELQMRIREYLRFIWKEENTHYFEDEQKIIGLLSNSLKDELLLNAYGSILKRFPMFFANFTEKTLTKAVSIIKDIRLFPEEEIFSENNQDKLAVYFIIKGKVELVTESGIVLKELKVGDLFGEIGFFSGRPRKLTARTKDFTTLFSINREEFLQILKMNTEDFEKFCMIQDQIVLYNNFFPLKIRCFCCNQIGHLSSKCSLIHFEADSEKVIKKFNFYLDQERGKFKRKYLKQNSLKMKNILEKSIKAIQMIMKEEDASYQSLYSSDYSIRDPDLLESDEGEINEDSSPKSSKVNTYSFSEKKTTQTEELKLFSKASVENIKSCAKIPNNENTTSKHTEVDSDKALLTNNPQGKENAPFVDIDNSEENKSDEKKSMEKCLDGKCDDVVAIVAKDVDIDSFEIKRSLNHDSLVPVALRSHENLTKKGILLDSNPKHNNHEEKRRKSERFASNITENKYFHSSSKKKTQIQTKDQIMGSMNKIYDKGQSTLPEENTGIYHNSKKYNATMVNNERSMDYFETVWCFKNYFPENNIKTLMINMTNKRNHFHRYNKIKEDRKKSLDCRLSKYTFFPEEMKMKLPAAIQKRMRMSLKKTKRSGGNLDHQSNYELKMETNRELMRLNNSKGPPRRYFTTQFLEQKFSDVVKYIMSHPNLKKLLKRNK